MNSENFKSFGSNLRVLPVYHRISKMAKLILPLSQSMSKN